MFNRCPGHRRSARHRKPHEGMLTRKRKDLVAVLLCVAIGVERISAQQNSIAGQKASRYGHPGSPWIHPRIHLLERSWRRWPSGTTELDGKDLSITFESTRLKLTSCLIVKVVKSQTDPLPMVTWRWLQSCSWIAAKSGGDFFGCGLDSGYGYKAGSRRVSSQPSGSGQPTWPLRHVSDTHGPC